VRERAVTVLVAVALAGLCGAAPVSAQEENRPAAWTYRASVADEITATRVNSASPFFGRPVDGALWDASNQFVATGDGAWTLNERIRAGAGMAVFGATGGAAALRVREAYVRVSAASWLDVEGGKRLVRWGTGYAFTPTGLLDPPRNATDPQDRLGLNEGMPIAQAVLFRGETALTVAAAAPRAWRSLRNRTGGSGESAALEQPERLVAAKLRTSVRGFEFALFGSAADGRRLSAGGNFTHVIGQQFEWHGEMLLHDRTSPWDARLDPRAVGARAFSALIGFQYTSSAGANLVVEAYHDGNGLAAAQWQRLVTGARAAIAEPSAGAAAASASVRPSRRNFVFVRAGRASTPRWRPELMTIVGADDGSVTIVPVTAWTVREHVEAYARGVVLAGARQSEAREAPVHATATMGVSLKF
jgi:hypothetical protein